MGAPLTNNLDYWEPQWNAWNAPHSIHSALIMKPERKKTYSSRYSFSVGEADYVKKGRNSNQEQKVGRQSQTEARRNDGFLQKSGFFVREPNRVLQSSRRRSHQHDERLRVAVLRLQLRRRSFQHQQQRHPIGGLRIRHGGGSTINN